MTKLADLKNATRDLGPILQAVGLLMVGKTQKAFDDQGRGGNRWLPRGVPNRIGVLEDLRAGRDPPPRRFEARPAGKDTGTLRNTIAFRVDGDAVVVGSTLSYASDVQRGATKTVLVDLALRRSLAAWLRSLRGDRRRAMQRAFGFLFRQGSLTVTTPPRPFVMITDEDRRQIVDLARKYFTGGFKT